MGSYSVGVTPSMLLSSDLSSLLTLNIEVTNGLILDLYYFMNRNGNCKLGCCITW